MKVIEALRKKDEQRADAEAAARRRTEELYVALPALQALDAKLASHGPAIAKLVFTKDREGLARLEAENRDLQEQRRQLLTRNGYRPDEDAPVYRCAVCRDRGEVNGSLCACVRELVAVDRYTSTGLGKGLLGKTFDNFSLRYYTGEDRTHMEALLSICRKYAETFGEDSRSLLFLGGTGLGKTHLSAAIAGEVAKQGWDVLYETSQKLFDRYETARFSQGSDERIERYESCDLLVVDDLGAECASKYTAATFFNLLNTRLINGKPMLINTNLNRPQLEKAYGGRVLSRLLGEFRVLKFVGTDVRMQKIAGGASE